MYRQVVLEKIMHRPDHSYAQRLHRSNVPEVRLDRFKSLVGIFTVPEDWQ